jgi:hypothetical protein
LRIVYIFMGDPRNVAHDKKVIQEKHHKGKDSTKGAGPAPQPGKKAHAAAKKQTVPEASPVLKTAETAKPEQQPDPTKLEKSLVVFSKLKELEFHSRGNIEKLAELSLTIEDELKQKAFVEPIGALYSAQDAFQSQILKLIEAYQAECARLKPPG